MLDDLASFIKSAVDMKSMKNVSIETWNHQKKQQTTKKGQNTNDAGCNGLTTASINTFDTCKERLSQSIRPLPSAICARGSAAVHVEKKERVCALEEERRRGSGREMQQT